MSIRHTVAIATGVALWLLSIPAFADPRVAALRYNPHAVVELSFCLGFETTVEFAPHEKIQNVAVGDSSRWQTVTNRRADALFIKPTAKIAHTNLTVLTDKRIYNFELRARATGCPRAQKIFSLSFIYPKSAKAPAAAKGPAVATKAPNAAPASPDHIPRRNSQYSYDGDTNLVPLRVYDDGKATYFRWPAGVPTPAIYAIDASGNKTLVNFHIEGKATVIDLVEPEFELRRGQAVCHLYNDGFKLPARDAESPQPRKHHESVLSFLGLN